MLKKSIHKFQTALLVVMLAISSLLSPLTTKATYNSTTAQDYLLAHQTSPWVTMALAATGASNIQTDYLKNISGTSAIDYEAPMLAISAIGQNPKTFGTTDYVTVLKNYYHDGQLGDPTTINDDIFGLLALTAADEPTSDSVVSGTKNFILSHQNSNGGWGYLTSGGSDSNMTSAAILSLVAAGTDKNDTHIQNALNYLKTTQNDDGGFAYDPTTSWGKDSDSSSTAWVMWALNSLGINSSTWNKGSNTPKSFLESYQATEGYFKYQSSSIDDSTAPKTTAEAVIALAGKFLPVKPGQIILQKFPFRIEGSTETVCSGEAAGPTAMDLVKNAAISCGFTYEVKSTNIGLYLNKINNDIGSGLNGWMYLVNNESLNVGAGDYQLKSGDSVIWYFGEYGGWKPTRLSLNPSEVTTGGSATASVEYYENGNWNQLPDANVIYGVDSSKTDSQGQASLSPADGYYKVYSQKEGYIRSNTSMLKVGQPSSNSVDLSVTLPTGLVDGDSTTTQQSSISFTVSPTNLDFGSLAAGDSASKDITIKNHGTTGITVQAVINGNGIFKDSMQISGATWKNFKDTFAQDEQKNETLKLTVPKNVALPSGKQSGQIIFWAKAN